MYISLHEALALYHTTSLTGEHLHSDRSSSIHPFLNDQGGHIMETSEQNTIVKSRLASFKQLVKSISVEGKQTRIAERSIAQWVSKEIHEPLIKAGKSTDEYSVSKSLTDEMKTKKSEFITAAWASITCATPDFLRHYTAREIHFAYSLIRGRKPQEIEQKVAKGNEINMQRVDNIIILMMGVVDLLGSTEKAALLSDDRLTEIRKAVAKDYFAIRDIRNKVFAEKSTATMFFIRK